MYASFSFNLLILLVTKEIIFLHILPLKAQRLSLTLMWICKHSRKVLPRQNHILKDLFLTEGLNCQCLLGLAELGNDRSSVRGEWSDKTVLWYTQEWTRAVRLLSKKNPSGNLCIRNAKSPINLLRHTPGGGLKCKKQICLCEIHYRIQLPCVSGCELRLGRRVLKNWSVLVALENVSEAIIYWLFLSASHGLCTPPKEMERRSISLRPYKGFYKVLTKTVWIIYWIKGCSFWFGVNF